MEKVKIGHEILPRNQGRVLFFDPTELLASRVEYHPCIAPITEDGHLADILKCLGYDNSTLILTPTALSNPLIVHFRYGHEFSAYRLNLEEARFTREMYGDSTPIGGIIDLSFIEQEYLRKGVTIERLVSSVKEQVHALRAGGIKYLFFQGFRDSDLLRKLIQSDIISDLPIAFTLSLEAASNLPQLVEEFQETTRVIAAGVELNLGIDKEGIYRLDTDKLEAQANRLNEMGIPMIVRLNFGYRFEDGKVEPIFKVDQIQQVIESIYRCGVRVIGIGSGATLPLVKELRQPETPIPAATPVCTNRVPVTAC